MLILNGPSRLDYAPSFYSAGKSTMTRNGAGVANREAVKS